VWTGTSEGKGENTGWDGTAEGGRQRKEGGWEVRRDGRGGKTEGRGEWEEMGEILPPRSLLKVGA